MHVIRGGDREESRQSFFVYALLGDILCVLNIPHVHVYVKVHSDGSEVATGCIAASAPAILRLLFGR